MAAADPRGSAESRVPLQLAGLVVLLAIAAYILLVVFVFLPGDRQNERECAKRGGWVSYDSGERGVCHVR